MSRWINSFQILLLPGRIIKIKSFLPSFSNPTLTLRVEIIIYYKHLKSTPFEFNSTALLTLLLLFQARNNNKNNFALMSVLICANQHKSNDGLILENMDLSDIQLTQKILWTLFRHLHDFLINILQNFLCTVYSAHFVYYVSQRWVQRYESLTSGAVFT